MWKDPRIHSVGRRDRYCPIVALAPNRMALMASANSTIPTKARVISPSRLCQKLGLTDSGLDGDWLSGTGSRRIDRRAGRGGAFSSTVGLEGVQFLLTGATIRPWSY